MIDLTLYLVIYLEWGGGGCLAIMLMKKYCPHTEYGDFNHCSELDLNFSRFKLIFNLQCS